MCTLITIWAFVNDFVKSDLSTNGRALSHVYTYICHRNKIDGFFNQFLIREQNAQCTTVPGKSNTLFTVKPKVVVRLYKRFNTRN